MLATCRRSHVVKICLQNERLPWSLVLPGEPASSEPRFLGCLCRKRVSGQSCSCCILARAARALKTHPNPRNCWEVQT